MLDITSETPTGEIATGLPSSVEVFRRLGIEFCCGGDRPLAEAVAQTDAKLDEVLDELRSLTRKPEEIDWSERPLGELIDHIVATHHAFVKRSMPTLWESLRKVLSVHGDRHTELHDVAKIVAQLFTELDEHLQKEEQILFPMIRRIEGGDDGAGVPEGPMAVMEDDHAGVGQALRRIRELTGDYTPPEDACVTYRSLYTGLEEFESDLHVHIHLENNVLHPGARALSRS